MKRIISKNIQKISYDEMLQMGDQIKVFHENVQSTFCYGATPGTIRFLNKSVKIEYPTQKINISVNIPRHGSKYDVFSVCCSYWNKYCYENNLLSNKHRIMEDDKGLFIEAIADGKTFYCDLEDILLYRSFSWHYRKSDKKIYAQNRESKIKLHTILFHDLLKPDYECKVVFIDGNSLNNRKHNLKFNPVAKTEEFS